MLGVKQTSRTYRHTLTVKIQRLTMIFRSAMARAAFCSGEVRSLRRDAGWCRQNRDLVLRGIALSR